LHDNAGVRRQRVGIGVGGEFAARNCAADDFSSWLTLSLRSPANICATSGQVQLTAASMMRHPGGLPGCV
jgi:hypothetical protein